MILFRKEKKVYSSDELKALAEAKCSHQYVKESAYSGKVTFKCKLCNYEKTADMVAGCLLEEKADNQQYMHSPYDAYNGWLGYGLGKCMPSLNQQQASEREPARQ